MPTRLPFHHQMPIQTSRGHAVRATRWQAPWQIFAGNRVGQIGLGLVALFGLMALTHPILMATVWDRPTYHPLVGFDYQIVPHPTPPSFSHLLGTDAMGRDVLSQLLYATGTSFGLGIVAGIVATSIATLLGMLSAHFGGWVDTIVMGLSDAFVLMPAPIVLLVIGLLIDLGWLEVGLLFGVFAGFGAMTIIAKTYALSIKVKPFVEAAKMAGGSGFYVLRVHYLPNMLSFMFVNMMFVITQSVLIEALLSFFGRTRLRMSWGTMIWFTQSTFRLSAYGEQWHAILPPVLAIMTFCGAFYMVGRALDEVVNPRLLKR